jgi:hypothetical protein
MAWFMVRVQLDQHPDSADYQNLHWILNAAHFLRFIQGEDGRLYALPHGQYVYHGAIESMDQVLDRALKLAHTVRPNPEVVVTEGLSKWVNLQVIGKP